MAVKTVNINMDNITILQSENETITNKRIHCKKCFKRTMHYLRKIPNLRVKYQGNEYNDCYIAHCYACKESRIVVRDNQNNKTAII